MKIFLSGYVKKNLGDDLFFKIILEKYPSIEFLMPDDGMYLKKYKNIKFYKSFNKINIFKKFFYKIMSIVSNGKINYFYSKINSCDGAVRIGGSLFIENDDNCKYKSFVKINVPFFVIGSNFGPYKSDFFYNKCLNLFVKSNGVSFRDSYSYDLFKDKIRCSYNPDLIFSLAEGYIEKYINKKNIVISIIDCSYRFDEKVSSLYEKTIINLIDKLCCEKYNVTLMSFCKYEGDEDAIERIISNVKFKENISKYFYDGDIEQALEVISSCHTIFASRFHANILGLAYKKNVIPLIYSDKTLNMLNDLKFDGKYYDIRNNNFYTLAEIEKKDFEYIYDLKDIPKKSLSHFSYFDNWVEYKK